MALPLPKVVADTVAGGPLVTAMRGQNALTQDMYDSQVKQAQAKYAPWTTYADAASKIAYANMIPYQVQATMMSNPMLWMALKDNPQAMNALVNNWKQSIPSPEQLRTGANMPPLPNSNSPRSDGLLSMAVNSLKSLFGGGQQPQMQGQGQPQMPQGMGGMPQPQGADSGYSYNPDGTNVVASPQEIAQAAGGNSLQAPPAPSGAPSNNALVPAAQGGMAGAAGKMTAPYMESPYTGGKTFVDDKGNVISAPDAANVQAAQTAIQGIKNLKPVLEDISAGAAKYLAPGEKGKVGVGQWMNWAKQNFGSLAGIPDWVMKQAGITSKDITGYSEWEAQQQKAVETYMKARQWPMDAVALQKISKIIEPKFGEGPEYGDRVTRELAQLETTLLPNYQSTLSGGYQLSGQQTQQQSVPQVSSPAQQNVNQAIKQGGEEYKSQMIKMRGVDPVDGKMKVWNVPQGKAQDFLDAGFKRVS